MRLRDADSIAVVRAEEVRFADLQMLKGFPAEQAVRCPS